MRFIIAAIPLLAFACNRPDHGIDHVPIVIRNCDEILKVSNTKFSWSLSRSGYQNVEKMIQDIGSSSSSSASSTRLRGAFGKVGIDVGGSSNEDLAAAWNKLQTESEEKRSKLAEQIQVEFFPKEAIQAWRDCVRGSSLSWSVEQVGDTALISLSYTRLHGGPVELEIKEVVSAKSDVSYNRKSSPVGMTIKAVLRNGEIEDVVAISTNLGEIQVDIGGPPPAKPPQDLDVTLTFKSSEGVAKKSTALTPNAAPGGMFIVKHVGTGGAKTDIFVTTPDGEVNLVTDTNPGSGKQTTIGGPLKVMSGFRAHVENLGNRDAGNTVTVQFIGKSVN